MTLMLRFQTDADRHQFLEQLKRIRPDVLPACHLSKTNPVIVFTGLTGDQQDWLRRQSLSTAAAFDDIDYDPTSSEILRD